MWSGPRNISTAMMRAWENRADTFVVDEPFYAHYLQATGFPHPGAEEVIASGETDWRRVVELVTTAAPCGRAIFYQKQMTHHLLPHIERSWLRKVTNCFLIRDPAEVIVSYLKKNGEPRVEDLGFLQQAEIFDYVCTATGNAPPVLDADDVLANPERMLRRFCEAIGVQFSEKMLSWPPGLRETDGVWAKHWYDEVAKSTGFAPPKHDPARVPEALRQVETECRAAYGRLHAHRLT